MRHESPPVLDYASLPSPRVAVIAWQSIVAVVGCGVLPPWFLCVCGHLNATALLATVPVALFAWWGLARRLPTVGRVVAGLIAVLASGIPIKNLLDVGWLGHSPLFR